jgi:hypothetical protein
VSELHAFRLVDVFRWTHQSRPGLLTIQHLSMYAGIT